MKERLFGFTIELLRADYRRANNRIAGNRDYANFSFSKYKTYARARAHVRQQINHNKLNRSLPGA